MMGVREQCELSDVIYDSLRDWDDYMDECQETETPPIYSFEDFIADSVFSAGYRKQKWLPASEPPKKPGIYQVFIYDKEMERTKVWYGQFTGCGWSVYDIYGDGIRCNVTHWMPLPEPPEEE